MQIGFLCVKYSLIYVAIVEYIFSGCALRMVIYIIIYTHVHISQ